MEDMKSVVMDVLEASVCFRESLGQMPHIFVMYVKGKGN